MATHRSAWSAWVTDRHGAPRRANGTTIAVAVAAVVSMGAAAYAGFWIADDERPPPQAALPAPAPSRIEPDGYPSPAYVAPSPSASPTPSPATPPPSSPQPKPNPTPTPTLTTAPARTSSSAPRTKTPVGPDRVIAATSVLTTGQSWSTDRLRLTVTGGGNLELRDRGRVVFQTGTTTGVKLVMQNDGHLVLYDAVDGTAWSSGTAGNPGAVLILRADGTMVISLNSRILFRAGAAG